MTLRASIAVLVLLALVACLYTLNAETWPYPRHTIGFPRILNTTLKRILNISSIPIRLNTSGAVIPSSETRVNVTSRIVKSAASNLGISPNELRWIIRSLPSDELKASFLKLLVEYYHGRVDEKLVESIMRELLSAYVKGRIDPAAYKAVVDIVERISRASGINYNELYGVAERYLTNIPMSELSEFSRAPTVFTTMPTLLVGNVKTRIIQVAIAICTSVLGIILAIILSRYWSRIRLRIVSLSTTIRRKIETLIYGPVVREYWSAVELLEHSLGIAKLPSETHREYMEKIRNRGLRIPPFEELTKLYELVRYAHEDGRLHELRAKQCLEGVKAWLRRYLK